MNYTVTYTRKGALVVSAPDPERAECAAREWLAHVTILDVIPEDCEDCTRAVRHTHTVEDDVHESYWAPPDDEQLDPADTPSAELTRSASLAQRYDAALGLLAQSIDLGWSTNAPARAALHQRIREFLR
jgi:hypothetical protein